MRAQGRALAPAPVEVLELEQALVRAAVRAPALGLELVQVAALVRALVQELGPAQGWVPVAVQVHRAAEE